MKLTALVIDDLRVMREMLMDALDKTELAEFEYVEAEDGVDALSKFNPKAIDIVFADWNMPRMTGIEFVRRARANPAASDVPIIMVTSEKTMGKMQTALDKVGANGYVCKPFTAINLTPARGPREDRRRGDDLDVCHVLRGEPYPAGRRRRLASTRCDSCP